MPKKLLQRWMPDPHKMQENKYLKIFGSLMHNPNLWHLNRHSAAKAFAVGLFCAFIPIPFQMILAASLAIIAHANLPLAVSIVWITNPLTMPAIFYACYLVGTLILGEEEQAFHFDASWQWVLDSLQTIGPAFLIGCGALALTFSVIGYFSIHALWRYSVARAWNGRNKK
jgi:uncharacterized protein